MSSSEDYLDSLLRSMGVPAELASPTKSASKKEAEEPAKQDPIVPDAVFTSESIISCCFLRDPSRSELDLMLSRAFPALMRSAAVPWTGAFKAALLAASLTI